MKPEFGNLDQINLIRLEAQYEGAKPAVVQTCGCNCPNCDAEVSVCPKCGDEIDLIIEKCSCGQRIIPWRDERTIKALRAKLNKPTK